MSVIDGVNPESRASPDEKLSRIPTDLVQRVDAAKRLGGRVPAAAFTAAVKQGQIRHWRFSDAGQSPIWVSEAEVMAWAEKFADPRRGTGPYKAD